MKKRTLCVVAGLGLAFVLCCCVPPLFNWWLRDADGIQESLLESTPLGTDINSVRSYAASKGWNHGPRESGRVITATLGSYQTFPWEDGFPFARFVLVFWRFNEHGKLQDISMQVLTDSD